MCSVKVKHNHRSPLSVQEVEIFMKAALNGINCGLLIGQAIKHASNKIEKSESTCNSLFYRELKKTKKSVKQLISEGYIPQKTSSHNRRWTYDEDTMILKHAGKSNVRNRVSPEFWKDLSVRLDRTVLSIKKRLSILKSMDKATINQQADVIEEIEINNTLTNNIDFSTMLCSIETLLKNISDENRTLRKQASNDKVTIGELKSQISQSDENSTISLQNQVLQEQLDKLNKEHTILKQDYCNSKEDLDQFVKTYDILRKYMMTEEQIFEPHSIKLVDGEVIVSKN